jgi:hypothetical protein
MWLANLRAAKRLNPLPAGPSSQWLRDITTVVFLCAVAAKKVREEANHVRKAALVLKQSVAVLLAIWFGLRERKDPDWPVIPDNIRSMVAQDPALQQSMACVLVTTMPTRVLQVSKDSAGKTVARPLCAHHNASGHKVCDKQPSVLVHGGTPVGNKGLQVLQYSSGKVPRTRSVETTDAPFGRIRGRATGIDLQAALASLSLDDATRSAMNACLTGQSHSVCCSLCVVRYSL